MKRAFWVSSLVLAALLVVAGCGSASGDLSNANTQRRFGVRMAKMNLWREAKFRFERATQIEPGNAQAHNNLAVALEAIGDFAGAEQEYRTALNLDRSNQYIQKNLSRLMEFQQKAKRRQQQQVAGGTAAASAAPATTTTTTAAGAAAAPQAPGAPAMPTAADSAPPATTTNPPEEGNR